MTKEEMEMSRLNFFFLKRELSKMECFFFECVNTQSILAGSLSFMLKIREEKEYCFLSDFLGDLEEFDCDFSGVLSGEELRI